MSSTDETYLESFIESIATLPHDVRRNLELLKTLDRSCALTTEELKQAEDNYINHAEKKILNLPVTKDDDGNVTVVPTTEELQSLISQPKLFQKIEQYRKDVEQFSDEKISVAGQTLELVDETLKRLDTDLAQFEA
mmetsp:Transcript_27343/g.33116  ORF Transcript_27343/g.33116 Transcript_27343/m.33116 type:complete len:136 (+) Transcript_27343:113-520(+)|eukprot:CAMPEP_0172506618 /NCGR_PEP_ID=MMETSP1066-20121228/196638_1 /TAXON_ID=671091 /ORGANISM="Coscinodiscus wailesii, Strain CCMP2513" /LENGTH=135 /DNA_ID=CAMNT_0013283715 /DNA_START=109 /DNA_END=516 /DNA_ORIENTATION=-